MMGVFSVPNLGVFCCRHVFRAERPVLLVSREHGDWQFLCGGGDHHSPEEPFHVGVGHLVSRDGSLNEVAALPAECEAERSRIGSAWTIRSERTFQLWQYTVSHGQLVLRSTKDSKNGMQLDVLFKNVQRVELPSLMRGLQVTPDDAPGGAHRRFKLTGREWQGAIVAGAMAWHGSNAEHFDLPVWLVGDPDQP